MRTSLFVAGALVSGSMMLVPLLTGADANARTVVTTADAVTDPGPDADGMHPARFTDSGQNRLANRVPEPTTLLMLGAGLLLLARMLNKPVERVSIKRR